MGHTVPAYEFGWKSITPWWLIACAFVELGGVIAWTVQSVNAMSTTEEGLRAIQCTVAALTAIKIIYIVTPVVLTLAAVMNNMLGAARCYIHQYHKVSGTIHDQSLAWIICGIILQITNHLLATWVAVVIAFWALWIVGAIVMYNSVNVTLEQQKNIDWEAFNTAISTLAELMVNDRLPYEITGNVATLVNVNNWCPPGCLNLKMFRFLTVDYLSDLACVCRPDELEEAQSCSWRTIWLLVDCFISLAVVWAGASHFFTMTVAMIGHTIRERQLLGRLAESPTTEALISSSSTQGKSMQGTLR